MQGQKIIGRNESSIGEIQKEVSIDSRGFRQVTKEVEIERQSLEIWYVMEQSS